MHILILDDTLPEPTAQFLTRKGHDVVYAETVDDARSYIRSDRPLDAVVVQSVADHNPKTGALFLPLADLSYTTPDERALSAAQTLFKFMTSGQDRTVPLIVVTDQDATAKRPWHHVAHHGQQSGCSAAVFPILKGSG